MWELPPENVKLFFALAVGISVLYLIHLYTRDQKIDLPVDKLYLNEEERKVRNIDRTYYNRPFTIIGEIELTYKLVDRRGKVLLRSRSERALQIVRDFLTRRIFR